MQDQKRFPAKKFRAIKALRILRFFADWVTLPVKGGIKLFI